MIEPFTLDLDAKETQNKDSPEEQLIHLTIDTEQDSSTTHAFTNVEQGDDADKNTRTNDKMQHDYQASNSSTLVSSCLAANSQEWLQSARYGNTPLNLSQAEFPFKGPLLDSLPALLIDAQPICHRKSPLMSIGNDSSGVNKEDGDETREVQMWKLRLMYLSVYYHQHHHAMEEAMKRQELQSLQGKQECHNDMKKYNVSTFDFECKDAKYLIAAMRNTGIGSLLKKDVHNLFAAAIATNRTVIFYNGVENGTSFYSYPWQLASCPRHDYQCSFQPLSGCVPTIKEIIRAPNVATEAFNPFINGKKGRKASWNDNLKVIRYENPSRRTIRATPQVLGVLHRIANLIIDELDPTDGRVPILRNAAQDILSETTNFDDALVLYMMRPTLDKGAQLNAFMENDIPPDFDSARSFGFPLRGSDKCNSESECLQFSTYMRLLKSRWFEEGFAKKYGQGSGNVTFDILITSEMKDVMEQAYAFTNSSKYMSEFPFTPRWITNTNDIRQNNGSTKRPILGKGDKADDIVISILSTFKLQMNAGSTIGNCCSNFHQVIMQLLRNGCGAEYGNKGQCLQSRNESIYQLCCTKKSDPRCVRERLRRMKLEYNNEDLTDEEAQMGLWLAAST